MSSSDYEKDPRFQFYKTGPPYALGPDDHRRGFSLHEEESPPPELLEPHVDTHGFFEIPPMPAGEDIDDHGPVGYHAQVVKPSENEIKVSQKLVEGSRRSNGKNKVTVEELAIMALQSAGRLPLKFSLSKKPPKPKKTI